jgi:hypothetical protein
MTSPVYRAITRVVGDEKARKILSMAQSKGLGMDHVEQVLEAVLSRLMAGVSVPGVDDRVTRMLRYKTEPVSVLEFLCGKFYMGKGHEIYPPVMQELVELNSGKYDEAVLTGGIGSGKTTVALYSQAYQLYQLSCLRNPHGLFGLDSSSEIKVIFQNIKEKLARAVDYDRFRDMIEGSPYFQRHFMFDKDLQSKLVFPNRIEVEPVSGSETASIGQNVIGGIIDEINFMAVVKDSKQSSDGGTYDQAIELYNTIARRRKSRFMQNGQMPGLLCLVSSKKTPGQFTDIKEEEARTNPRIFVYDKRVWDIKPTSFTGEKFPVFIGDESRQPKVLEPSEVQGYDPKFVDHIPVEFRQEFRDDITKALRDIAGKSTMAIHPFMPDVERVSLNFGKRKSVIEQERVDFVGLRPVLFPKLITSPNKRRFAHIDLSLTGDSAGLVIGHCPGFMTITREEVQEVLPIIAIDCALEISPPPSGEIEFANIRRVLYRLRELGLPITWVTLDSFQSADTMQILRAQSFVTGYQSMDTSIVPYQLLKSALYDGRVPMPVHSKLKRELLTLERDFKKGKIDHPSKGSKDVSDALAGVVHGLTMRREIWAENGVDPISSPSVFQYLKDQKLKAET